MSGIELSSHARDMLIERNIAEEWVWRTIASPDSKRIGSDRNTHYAKAIEERGDRVLRVIVNPHVRPRRVVTVFFDRRLGDKMKLKIDKENDVLYLRLDEAAIVESEEVQPGVVLDFDAAGRVVGIEILALSTRASAEKLRVFQLETA
jgi:uncharacterized protein YuzE